MPIKDIEVGLGGLIAILGSNPDLRVVDIGNVRDGFLEIFFNDGGSKHFRCGTDVPADIVRESFEYLARKLKRMDADQPVMH